VPKYPGLHFSLYKENNIAGILVAFIYIVDTNSREKGKTCSVSAAQCHGSTSPTANSSKFGFQ